MKKLLTVALVLVFITAGAAVFAQDQSTQQDQTQQGQMQDQSQQGQSQDQSMQQNQTQQDRNGLTGSMYRVSELMDMNVIGPQTQQDQTGGTLGSGEAPAAGTTVQPAVGSVEDAIFTSDGSLSYLLMNLTNFQGVDSGTYLVPAGAVSVQNQNLQIDMQQAQQNLIMVENKDQAAQQAGQNAIQASKLFDYNVVGSDGNEIGGISDVVVDLQNDKVAYAVLARGGFLGIGADLYALPFSDLQVSSGQDQVSVNATDQTFKDQKGFDDSNWPQQPQTTLGSGQSQQQSQGQDQSGQTQSQQDQSGQSQDQSGQGQSQQGQSGQSDQSQSQK